MTRLDASPSAPPTNLLLSALPNREYKRLVPHLEQVPLPFRATLHEPGQPITHLYFPTCGMLSLLLPRDDRGGRLEVGIVGREGMAGLSAVLGVATEFTQSLVQVPGEALRLPVEKFHAVADRDSKLLKVLLRYLHVFLTQLSQRVACNALHTVEKRLCFWLLTVHDQAGADRFPLTHEFLAAMLGVRRASVTEVARRLRQARLIRYGGGQVMVLNRHGLERAACDCYRVIKMELNRVLG